MDEPPKGGRFRVRLDPESAERLRRATESTEDRVRSAMAEALRREEERIFGEIFGRQPAGSGSTYSSGKAGATPWDDETVRDAFTKARDFGRWSDKVSEPIWEGGTPCQAFATPTRSVFGTGPYLAVSEEPEVAVAAAQLRAERENVKGGSFNAADRAVLLAGAEAKLKRRILAANRRRETQP